MHDHDIGVDPPAEQTGPRPGPGERISMLSAAAVGLATATDPGEVAETVLRVLGRDPDVAGGRLLPPSEVPGDQPLWLVSAEEIHARIPDRETPPEEAACAILPLSAEQEKLGALLVSFRRPQRFPEEDREFLLALAAVSSQALARVRLREQEQRARVEAEEAGAAKDQFVSLISHELRNPLSAIQLGIGILRMGASLQGEMARALEVVERNARLQARLINDLLDLSRLTRGKLLLQRAPVDLGAVTRAGVDARRAEAETAGVEITREAEPDLWVHGDFDRLQQVVGNLIANAIKFTPPPGRVTVASARCGRQGSKCERGPQWACIVVEDTGIGIDPAVLAGIFDIFQPGRTGPRRGPGLGLGLALVKGIVERHGGRVRAESEGPGKGSRFVVELPLLPPPQGGAGGPAGESKRIRLLLLEDNPDTRTLISDGLEVSGYQVRQAESAEEALRVLARWRPDLILADLGLPGMDGCEFLRRARRIPGIALVPAFAVSGFGSEEDVRRGRDAGFVGHFVKPVDLITLDRRLREWMGLPSRI
jgi:signal transduction histidine kinase